MKKARVLTIAIIAVMAIATTVASAATIKKAEIQTSAYSFEQKSKMETKLMDMDGIEDAYLNTSDKVLTVEYDEEQISVDMITYKIVNELGFQAELIDDKPVENKDSKQAENEDVDIDNETKLKLRSSIIKTYQNAVQDFLNSVFRTSL